MIGVQLLDGHFADAYQTLWLNALRQHPEFFSASFEEEAAVSLEKRAVMLDGSPNDATFGALEDGRLIGIAKIVRHFRRKMRHRATITGMYVAPEARSKGAGKALMDAMLNYGRKCEGIDTIVLAVTVGNEPARNLYLQAGFQFYYFDPRFLRIGSQYYDLEWMILNYK